MTTTLAALEGRLGALEQEVADIRRMLGDPRSAATSPEWGSPLMQAARASQPAISAAVAKAFTIMGIAGETVGAERLQQMMIAAGVNPADNAASREIMAMREE